MRVYAERMRSLKSNFILLMILLVLLTAVSQSTSGEGVVHSFPVEMAGAESATAQTGTASLLLKGNGPCSPIQSTEEIVSLQQTEVVLAAGRNERPRLLHALFSLLFVLLCAERFFVAQVCHREPRVSGSDLDSLIFYIHNTDGLKR